MSKYQALIDALEAFPAGWTIDAARPGVIHGTANIGAIHEGEFYGFITVDTDDYNHPEQATPIADYIAKANPAAIRALLADLERAEGALERVQRILRSTPYHVDKDELFAVVDAALAQMAGG